MAHPTPRLFLLAPLLLAAAWVTDAAMTCGDSQVPYSLEILPNGEPVLGCARPADCLGWGAIESSWPTGGYNPQSAKCSAQYEWRQCRESNEWVGGIYANASTGPVLLQCCEYAPLHSRSIERGSAIVGPGQIVIGGEVLNERDASGAHKRQHAYDYISNIVKRVDTSSNRISYEVQLRRMPCLSSPSADNSITDIATSGPSSGRPRAHQAPLYSPGGPVGAGGQGGIQPGGQQLYDLYYVPANQGGYFSSSSGGGGGMYCFSGDTQVRTAAEGMKRMDQLALGDWVLSADAGRVVYSRVDSWVHRVPKEEAEFQQISLENGRKLKITAGHFIYMSESCEAGQNGQEVSADELKQVQPVFAERVRPGDCLYVAVGDNEVSAQPTAFSLQCVTEVEVVREAGYYAPMTSTGDILVEGILASCYSILPSPVMQNAFFSAAIDEWFSPMFDWLGSSDDASVAAKNEVTRLPRSVDLATQLMEFVLPKNIYLL